MVIFKFSTTPNLNALHVFVIDRVMEVAQPGEVRAAKPDSVKLIPRTHIMKGESQLLQITF